MRKNTSCYSVSSFITCIFPQYFLCFSIIFHRYSLTIMHFPRDFLRYLPHLDFVFVKYFAHIYARRRHLYFLPLLKFIIYEEIFSTSIVLHCSGFRVRGGTCRYIRAGRHASCSYNSRGAYLFYLIWIALLLLPLVSTKAQKYRSYIHNVWLQWAWPSSHFTWQYLAL